ncbi:MAG: antitoxin VbhA family protein [Defluviitaleaceae bacterium]|nr:antitoxin VbhA family protein [Defluviitaleaceae bacterium]MCL2274435.1 antitoxin VbhA family protein [Defluviitaleaceae bacterium]
MNKQSGIPNEEAWDYAIGIVQVEGIKPSKDFLELAEKEKRGELTNDDIRRVLVKKYTVTSEAVHA